LRDSNTGHYVHHGMALMFGEEESDRAMRESHRKAFTEWLNYTLDQQKADLDLYLSGLVGSKRTLLETWQRLTPYRNLVPAFVRRAERQLYLTDLETLLNLLMNEYGVSCPDPDA